jgi:hypothetical protein
MQAAQSILAALVAPHAVEEFLSVYWPETAFAAHGDPGRLPSFLRAPELADVETLSRKYRGNLRFTSGRKYQKMVGIDRVAAISLYRMGLTVQFEDIAPYVTPVATELRRLEFELGVNPGAAQASVFASPVSEGLSAHFDAQDIFSIQLRGRKRFHIAPVTELRYPSGIQFVPGSEPFDDLYPQASGGFPEAARADFRCVEMAPGSVLFMPRGTWHYTESDGDSMSVSIGLYTPAAVDMVLEQLRLLLLQSAEWRRPLYGAWGSDGARGAAAAHAARLLADLPDLSRQLTVDDLMTGVLSPEVRSRRIVAHSRFQKTPHSRIEVEPAPIKKSYDYEKLSIKVWEPNYGERISASMEISPQATAVFRWIAERSVPFTAAELAAGFPVFPFAEHERMLRVAADTGLVKMLWFPALVNG